MNVLWEGFLDGKYRCYVKEEENICTMYFENAYKNFSQAGKIIVQKPSLDVEQTVKDWMVAASSWADRQSI